MLRRIGLYLFLFFTTLSAKELNYTAYQNNKPSHTVLINIHPTGSMTEIVTTLSGGKVKETNVCWLSEQNEFIGLIQTTDNPVDKAKFHWSIQKEDVHYKVHYESKKEFVKNTWKLPSKSYPMQAIIYLLQTLPLAPNYTYNFMLITPPKQTYPITLTVLEKANLTLEKKTYACFKVEAKFNNIIGGLFPKPNFWISVNEHTPLQYEDARFIYKLNEYDGPEMTSITLKETLLNAETIGATIPTTPQETRTHE